MTLKEYFTNLLILSLNMPKYFLLDLYISYILGYILIRGRNFKHFKIILNHSKILNC